MQGFCDDIEKLTETNELFRKVLFTGKHMQLVLMTLKPGEEIGAEVHDTVDQFIRVESGKGRVTIDDDTMEVADGFAVIIPAGSRHNVVNTGDTALKLYTLYAPPNHPAGTVHATREEALADEHEHHQE